MRPPSVDELVAVVHRHYPSGIAADDPRYYESEEHRRLALARLRAGAERATWNTLLGRLDAELGGAMEDRSLHLAVGRADAGYAAALHLPATAPVRVHTLGLVVSFLAPVYVLYSSRITVTTRPTEARAECVIVGDTAHLLPAEVVRPELRTQVVNETQQDVAFELPFEAVPYASAIARAIEGIFEGYVALPHDTGAVLVPDVATASRPLGEARLHDCLFTDAW